MNETNNKNTTTTDYVVLILGTSLVIGGCMYIGYKLGYSRGFKVGYKKGFDIFGSKIIKMGEYVKDGKLWFQILRENGVTEDFTITEVQDFKEHILKCIASVIEEEV